jgi:hypothetical protein
MSVEIHEGERWAFIIDTDSYAGNFERELAAYCTGATAQCNHGDGEAELFDRDFNCAGGWPDEQKSPFYEGVDHRPDDHGNFRPVSIYQRRGLKGSDYHSLVIFFYKKPTDEQIRILKERAHKFVNERWGQTKLTRLYDEDAPKIKGFGLVHEVTTVKEEPV